MHYLIVDDEPQARRLLHTYMKELGYHDLVASCGSASEALKFLNEQSIDLMFLDIKMPVIAGNDFLRSLTSPPLTIFTTAFPAFAIDGYELDVVDYLLKPISFSRMQRAVKKVLSLLSDRSTKKENEYIFIRTTNSTVKIELQDILLIEGMQNYIRIHVKDRVIIASYTMKAAEKMFPMPAFLRVHRSFIVPFKRIKLIKSNYLETDYRKIPIGVTYRTVVTKAMYL